jgi:Fe-S-cluster-containing dehydrogenase component
MPKYSLMVDVDLCIGCQACEVACKQENNIPMGPKWISVIQVGPKEVNGKLKMSFVPVFCKHCAQPVCMDVCPAEAITQRSDGIVLINSNLCTGCKACIEACPFGAPTLNADTNTVEMCTMCVHRIDKGLEPACILACPTQAIRLGDTNKLINLRRERYAKSLV